MSNETYEVMQAISQLLLTREYKPQEMHLFGMASTWLSSEMKAWEASQIEETEGSDSSGSED